MSLTFMLLNIVKQSNFYTAATVETTLGQTRTQSLFKCFLG